MTLRQLRYFVAVAEAGHITRAAAALGLQQPPLSQQIRAMETAIGTPLFQRHARGVALTGAGRELLPRAQRLLEAHAALMDDMRLVAAGMAGVLAVGMTSSAAAHAFTPRLLREWRRTHPRVQLRITEANAAKLTELVDSGSLHAAFLRVPVERSPNLRFETLLTEDAVLALPIDHALTKRTPPGRPVALVALRGERLILTRRPGAPGLYANLLQRLERLGVEVEVVAEVDRMLTNLNLVASGEGVTVVPASMQGLHALSVAYRPLPAGDRLEAPLTLVCRAEGPSPLLLRFCNAARYTAGLMAPKARATPPGEKSDRQRRTTRVRPNTAGLA